MWFKVDDKLHDHPKVHRLLEDGHVEALGLWLVAGSWCGDQLSDGLISGYVLARWSETWRDLAAQLVAADLWEEVEHNGRPHWRFHDWLDYNDSREKVEADRHAAKMRVALYRDKPLVAAVIARDKDRCRYCGTLVNWASKRGNGGGTYDHVIPVSRGGLNTLKNVVASCRGCNSRKGDLTLAEAGMTLLKPGSLGAPVLDDEPGDPRPVTGNTGVNIGSGRVGTRNVLSTNSATPDTAADDPDLNDPDTDPAIDDYPEDGTR